MPRSDKSVKLSVSVPLYAWTLANHICAQSTGDDSASHVVQTALKEYIYNHKDEIDPTTLLDTMLLT